MQETTKNFVAFHYPGVFRAEESHEEVGHKNPDLITPPKNCFAFSFFDRTETTTNNGEVLRGNPKNHSDKFYVGGKTMTLAEVKSFLPDQKILIENMESNNWNKVIKTRFGNFLPFQSGDCILPE